MTEYMVFRVNERPCRFVKGTHCSGYLGHTGVRTCAGCGDVYAPCERRNDAADPTRFCSTECEESDMTTSDESHVTHDGGPPPEGGTHKGRREDCPGPSCGPTWYDDVPSVDLPGMWELSDFTGGETDNPLPSADPFVFGPGVSVWFVADFDGTCERGGHVFTAEDVALVRTNDDDDFECRDCVTHDDAVNASAMPAT